jgi:phage tail sheath gpL-like
MVTFNAIPNTLREPGVLVEFDGTKAQQGPSIQPYHILVIGNKLAAGTQPAETPLLVTDVEQARVAFGAGSMLHHMAEKIIANNGITKTTFIAQDDAGASVAATGTFTFVGTATAAGTIYMYLGGRRVTAAVAVGDDETAVATAVAAAATAADALAVTAGSALGVVTFTARNKGDAGNDIDLRLNYRDGEELPTGITNAVVAMSGGSGDPDITDVISAIGDVWYNAFVVGYASIDAQVDILETELADRFGPIRSIDGMGFWGMAKANHAALITELDTNRNSPHTTIMPTVNALNPPWEWAAATAGQVMARANSDPARPYTLLPLLGILAPADEDQFTYAERNLLLHDGGSTFTIDAGGVVRLGRVITTYQETAGGAPDTAFLQVETLLTLSYLRYDFRTLFQIRFPSAKVADDGTRFGPGQAVITPKIGRAFALDRFKLWEELALVEGEDQFKTDLVVERNAGDPTRLDFLLPPDLVNQLFIAAARIEFRL